MRLALSLRRPTSVVQLVSLVWAPYLPDAQGRIESVVKLTVEREFKWDPSSF
jgi:hypothetical protein